MKNHTTLGKLLILALLLGLAPAAHALSLWYVDGVHGSDQNNCKTPVTACKTIGHTISLASSGDSIFVFAATYSEHGLTVSINLTIAGSGASATIIDGRGARAWVMAINSGAHVSLTGFTIRNGGGGTCDTLHTFYGGGVQNAGVLIIANATIADNRGEAGAGIYNTGTLTVNDSTISGNRACSGLVTDGGGLYNAGGTATINTSTITGNSASGQHGGGSGGGIYTYGSVTIASSTISDNTAARYGGGLYVDGGAITIKNSIVANNIGFSSPMNCFGSVVSDGYNLSSDNTCDFHQAGDLDNVDPLLGPLQNNGGPTQTQALLAGSPAIDAGNPSGCTDGSGQLLTTDQRGMPRPDHEDQSGCDMGAYERQTD
jgi:hypothetical protein